MFKNNLTIYPHHKNRHKGKILARYATHKSAQLRYGVIKTAQPASGKKKNLRTGKQQENLSKIMR
jgi:hypothetical protein